MRPTILTKATFDELRGMRGKTISSILLPTHVKGPETDQDRIRLKNALAEVDEMLEAAAWGPRDRREQLAAATDLLDDEDFWAHQGRGLALYIDEAGGVVPIRLASGVESLVTITDRPHIRHLVQGLERGALPALLLTKGSVAVYDVDSGSIEKLDMDLPASMGDVNWFVDHEMEVQRHADTAGSAGVQHGHDPTDRMDEEVDRFLREVVDNLDVDGRPLVVFGNGQLVDRFRELFDGDVIEETLDGSGGDDPTTQIQRRVSELIDRRAEEWLAHNREAALEAAGAQPDSIGGLTPGLEAAVAGRIDELFIRADLAPVWGRFDASTITVAEAEPEVGAVDLYDRLVWEALDTGAQIRPFDGDDTPEMVASLRF